MLQFLNWNIINNSSVPSALLLRGSNNFIIDNQVIQVWNSFHCDMCQSCSISVTDPGSVHYSRSRNLCNARACALLRAQDNINLLWALKWTRPKPGVTWVVKLSLTQSRTLLLRNILAQQFLWNEIFFYRCPHEWTLDEISVRKGSVWEGRGESELIKCVKQ